MERQRDEALLLSAVDHGESDRVVTFLTRRHGRLSAFAAGARRSKRRFGGTLEPFMHLNILWVQGRGELVR
ncbi:MAG TPA: DNA repair protein RecO, partial [Myxococcaceae bacterium]|nr:DNA repair protein RecO [Myxococcaceae bacterium]